MDEETGGVFAVVSLNKVTVYIANGQAVESIFTVRNDFPKPKELYKGVEILSPNVDSVNGANRQRHRKITATPSNERNSGLVRMKSLRQVQRMIKEWSPGTGEGTTTTTDNTITLALHVLAFASFGMSYISKQKSIILPLGHTTTYRDGVSAILITLPIFIPWNDGPRLCPKRKFDPLNS